MQVKSYYQWDLDFLLQLNWSLIRDKKSDMKIIDILRHLILSVPFSQSEHFSTDKVILTRSSCKKLMIDYNFIMNICESLIIYEGHLVSHILDCQDWGWTWAATSLSTPWPSATRPTLSCRVGVPRPPRTTTACSTQTATAPPRRSVGGRTDRADTNTVTLQGYAGQYTSMMGATAPHSGTEYPPASSSTSAAARPRSPQASLGGAGNGPVTPSAPLTAPLTTANVGSCKYADSNVGSPQDLSTTSSGGTPQPPGMGSGLKSPDSDIEDSEPTSPLSPDPKGEGGASSSATSTKKEDSKSTPPQIYPWMKRVHLGQSK